MFPIPHWAKFYYQNSVSVERKKIQPSLLRKQDYNKFLFHRRHRHQTLLGKHLNGETGIRSSDPHLLPDQPGGPG